MSCKPLHALLLACTALVLGGCASTTDSGTVGAERKQLLLVSSDAARPDGRAKLRQTARRRSQKGTLNTDAALTQRVRAIATRIEPQTTDIPR